MTQPDSSSEHDGANVVVLPPILYAGSVLLGVVLHWMVPLGFASGSWLRMLLGGMIATAALPLVLQAFARFKDMEQDPNPRASTPAITREGPYRFTRNPMYVALTTLQTGIAVTFGNFWILLLLIPTVAVMHFGVILREEAYLEGKFGEEYLDYKRSVRRWI